MSRFPRIAVAIGSGVALALAFPEPDVFPLAWCALAPLLVVTSDMRARPSFGVGLAFGIAFFGTLLYWISIVGWVAWALLVLLEALFIGLFAGLWAANAHRLSSWTRVLYAAALWVVIEYLRTRIPLGGFTWGQLAQSQHNATWILHAASLGGSWLVAFLLAAVNALLAEAFLASRRGAHVYGVVVIVLAALLLVAPLALPMTATDGRRLRVAIVQGNVPRNFAGSLYDKEMTIIRSHERLTKALGSGVDLVVWPESSVGIDLEKNREAAAAVRDAARTVSAPMVVGGNLDLGPDRYKVMAFHVSDEGDVVDRYQKTHLVPFGEYVPARSSLDWLEMLDQVPRDAVPGEEETVFDIEGVPVAPIISFEGDFGSLARRRIDKGGRLLVVATNTSTWEESWASAQHVAFSQVRAAENGVWVVHAALSGISAFIDPHGTEIAATPLWEATSLTRTVGVATTPTFYARTGDWLPALCLAIAVALGIMGIAQSRKRIGHHLGEHDDPEKDQDARETRPE
ncbi:MAG: apolipoprotein N-acyltransferase [Actinomycetota bacterium]|nr:apolipoprotein N-acyltransferase [Actinomycetota bacterium]